MTANTDVRQLLPCPFCGGTDLNTEGDNAVWCKNRQCEAGIDFGHYVGSAAREAVHAAWNRRAALSASAEAPGREPVAWRFRLRNGDWHVVTDFPEWLTDKSTVQPLGVIAFPASGSDLERAAKLVKRIGEDWKQAGAMDKFHACEYLEQAIRQLQEG